MGKEKRTKKKKWINLTGDLIYYYYHDEIFFVDFIPYTRKRSILRQHSYVPELKKYAAEFNYCVITWGYFLTAVAMGILYLIYVE